MLKRLGKFMKIVKEMFAWNPFKSRIFILCLRAKENTKLCAHKRFSNFLKVMAIYL